MRDFIFRALLTYNFDYINKPLEEDNELQPLLRLIKDLGSSGYRLMRIVGIAVFFVAVLIGGAMLSWSKNAKSASENMKRLARIVVGACGVFAILGILSILLSMSDMILASY